jgi:hypothetical protein
MKGLGRCAVVVATGLLAAGCGSGSPIAKQPSDQPAYSDGAVRLNVTLQAHTTSRPGWSQAVTLRRGESVTMRLLIRNEDASGSGDVRAAVRLPRSLVVDPATVQERSVPEVEALGDAVPDPDVLFGRGLVLGPFPPHTFTTIQLTAKPRGGASGTATPTAHVTTVGTDSRTRLSVRLG